MLTRHPSGALPDMVILFYLLNLVRQIGDQVADTTLPKTAGGAQRHLV
jgi:hypothetical protein